MTTFDINVEHASAGFTNKFITRKYDLEIPPTKMKTIPVATSKSNI